MPVVNDQFVTGDPRVMENPELSAITILFTREHNFWISQLKAQNPTWTGDQLGAPLFRASFQGKLLDLSYHPVRMPRYDCTHPLWLAVLFQPPIT